MTSGAQRIQMRWAHQWTRSLTQARPSISVNTIAGMSAFVSQHNVISRSAATSTLRHYLAPLDNSASSKISSPSTDFRKINKNRSSSTSLPRFLSSSSSPPDPSFATMDEVRKAFESQSVNQWRVRKSTAEERSARLLNLNSSIESHADEVRAALASDLGKPGEEAEFELKLSCGEIDDAVANLGEWMKPTEVTPRVMVGCPARVIYEARGMVLLFGPWNFPFALVMQPLVSIIAAGNTAIVKPNEMASATSVVTAKILREVFDHAEVATFEGGVDLANDMQDLPFDHVFLTGSPAVGRIVMEKAARHLASVTLELGGKNPVIIDKDADVADAAQKVASMRNMNSGQVCQCPENIYVHEDKKAEFLAAAKATYQTFYKEDQADKLDVDKIGKIIDKRNLNRIKGYLNDAKSKGATIETGGQVVEDTMSVQPTILTDIPPDARILSEEVFGPILSVFTYQDVEEVYVTLHSQPKPLALYVFSQNQEFIDDVLANTSSGGVTVNNCLYHAVEPSLPFGGVGASGMGRYHGIYGFRELSHHRSVLSM